MSRPFRPPPEEYPLDSGWLTNGFGGSFHHPDGDCPAVSAFDTRVDTRKTLRECLTDGNSPCGHCVDTDRLPDVQVVLDE